MKLYGYHIYVAPPIAPKYSIIFVSTCPEKTRERLAEDVYNVAPHLVEVLTGSVEADAVNEAIDAIEEGRWSDSGISGTNQPENCVRHARLEISDQ